MERGPFLLSGDGGQPPSCGLPRDLEKTKEG